MAFMIHNPPGEPAKWACRKGGPALPRKGNK